MEPPADRSPQPTVAVVGGGFSGALTAVNIVRLAQRPIRVVVIEPRGALGRGAAYAPRRPEYLLNVAARNMSALADDPDHFVRWLCEHPLYADRPEFELRESFSPRHLYGDYLDGLVNRYLRGGDGGPVTVETVTAEAVDVTGDGDRCVIALAGGGHLDADRVVLATGNQPPATLPGADALAEHPGWVGDPWRPWEHRLPSGGGVVVLGTGLSAVDAILTLRAKGWLGTIDAVSRHGWFPHGHFRGIDYPAFPPAGVDLASLGLSALVAMVGEHCAALHERNAHPAIVVDKLRPHTQRIWAGFDADERLTFARSHAARWNVHRHRIAPQIHSAITDAQLTGQLRVHAKSIDTVRAAGRQVRVELAGGGALCGDVVINATGPSLRLTATTSPLLANLLRRGWIAPDPTDMGIGVDDDHTVVTADGRSPRLLALGPLLRGTYWETVAVPELRVQARRVAETLLGRAPERRDEQPVGMEYMV